MKNRMISVLMMLALVLSLVGCSGTSESSESPSDKDGNVKLLLWWWGEGDTPGSKAWLEETIEKYKDAAPNVTIEMVEQTSDQLYPAWESAIQAESGPDIQFLWTGIWALDYVWKDNLADITELISEEEVKHWTGTEGLEYDGKPWLSPWYQISIVWMYNKELFAGAGLNPDNPPSTWEELLEACEALKKTDVIPLELGGMKDGWGAPWIYAAFAPAAHDSMKEFVEAATIPGEFTSERHMDWFEKIHELVEKEYTNPMTMSYDFYQGRESFLRGESAMGLATNGQAIQWIEEMGGEEKVGIMNVPVMGDGKLAGKLNNQSHSFAIPSFAKHKKEAADFLVFTHQPEQLESWYKHTKNIPCDDRFDEKWLETESEKQIYQELMTNSVPYPEIFIPAMVDQEGMYAATQMIFSGSTPKEAAQYMEDTAEKWRSMDAAGVENFTNWGKSY